MQTKQVKRNAAPKLVFSNQITSAGSKISRKKNNKKIIIKIVSFTELKSEINE